MTREEIMAMDEEALNRAVHKKVFGYDWLPYVSPNYSTDISAAWDVVGMFDYLYLYRWEYQPCKFIVEPGEWECRLTDKDEERFVASGNAAPEAICRAALLTMID